jgi:hypothetical protein
VLREQAQALSSQRMATGLYVVFQQWKMARTLSSRSRQWEALMAQRHVVLSQLLAAVEAVESRNATDARHIAAYEEAVSRGRGVAAAVGEVAAAAAALAVPPPAAPATAVHLLHNGDSGPGGVFGTDVAPTAVLDRRSGSAAGVGAAADASRSRDGSAAATSASLSASASASLSPSAAAQLDMHEFNPFALAGAHSASKRLSAVPVPAWPASSVTAPPVDAPSLPLSSGVAAWSPPSLSDGVGMRRPLGVPPSTVVQAAAAVPLLHSSGSAAAAATARGPLPSTVDGPASISLLWGAATRGHAAPRHTAVASQAANDAVVPFTTPSGLQPPNLSSWQPDGHGVAAWQGAAPPAAAVVSGVSGKPRQPPRPPPLPPRIMPTATATATTMATTMAPPSVPVTAAAPPDSFVSPLSALIARHRRLKQ